VTLATTAFKINTYVRKELEDLVEGQLEDFDVDKERELLTWSKSLCHLMKF